MLRGLSSAGGQPGDSRPDTALYVAQFHFTPSGCADPRTEPPPCSACPSRSARSPVSLTGSERGGRPDPAAARRHIRPSLGFTAHGRAWPGTRPSCPADQPQRGRSAAWPGSGWSVAARPTGKARPGPGAAEVLGPAPDPGTQTPAPRPGHPEPGTQTRAPRPPSLLHSPALCGLQTLRPHRGKPPTVQGSFPGELPGEPAAAPRPAGRARPRPAWPPPPRPLGRSGRAGSREPTVSPTGSDSCEAAPHD